MSAKKQKTLYGRYDLYGADDADPGMDTDALSDGNDTSGRQKRINRAMRLVDIMPENMSGRTGNVPIENSCPSHVQTAEARPVPTVPKPAHQQRHTRSMPTMLPALVSHIFIHHITAEGELLTVLLEGETQEGERILQNIRITPAQYTTLHLQIGAITADDAACLAEAGQWCASVNWAMTFLAYGDLSVRRMVWKLTSRGMQLDMAAKVAAYLQERGILQEDTAAERRAVQDTKKLWGPRRILQDLRAQGYAQEAVQAAMEALTDPENPEAVDYAVNCATLICRKYGALPSAPGERRRAVAALMRLGYTSDQIREAAHIMRDN